VASYALIAAGVILLVVAGLSIGYRQWERRRLEARLTQTAPTPTAAQPTAVVQATATRQPTDTPEPPTATPKPTEVPTSATVVEPSPTEPAPPTPTAEPSPVASSASAAPAQLPVRIVFSDLEIDAQVVEMGWKVGEVDGTRTSIWDLDAIAGGKAGHLLNSALPGQQGNVVIAGHHNIEGQVFKNISLAWSDQDAVVQEDGITERSSLLDGRPIRVVGEAGHEFTYVVEGMYRLPDRDASQAQRVENGRFMASTGEPILTLVTCWPFDTNTHRIVVVARLAGTES
jgi:sortase A